MAAIITGANGILAYYNASDTPQTPPAFGIMGTFHRPLECAFAALPAFSANSNHPPSDIGEGETDWDAGIDLLFRIADAR